MNIENRVAKFGGTSLATSERIRHAAELAKGRRFVVVSAPGKRNPGDKKITDLLLNSAELAGKRRSFDESFGEIASRFSEIGTQLGIEVNSMLQSVREGIAQGKGRDWAASRGEWLTAKIFAEYTGREFVDPEEIIVFDARSRLDSEMTQRRVRDRLSSADGEFVIPGFYGANREGEVVVFSRGGSDITGAIIAAGVGSDVYENWTDVNGVRFTDPRKVPDARVIPEITYDELRELGNAGTEVLHPDSILPVRRARIPVNLLNTFEPGNPGTMIVSERESPADETIVGLAGKEGYVALQIKKDGMNEQEGAVEKLLEPLHRHKIPFDHIPTGKDLVSVLLHGSYFHNGDLQQVMDEIGSTLTPDELFVVHDIGLVTLVGQKIVDNKTRISRLLYSALDDARIEINSEISAVGGNSITIGVQSSEVSRALRVLYDQFAQ